MATEYELYQMRQRVEQTSDKIVDLLKHAQHLERVAYSPASAQAYLHTMAEENRQSARAYEEKLKRLEQELREATGEAK